MHAVRLLSGSPASAPRTTGAEIFDNARWPTAKPAISVVVPTFRFDCSELATRLSNLSTDIELLIHDDGSGDPVLTDALTQTVRNTALPVRLVSSRRNRGRAGARNAAVQHARAQWVLLLDSDMLPDSDRFISRYAHAADAAAGPCLIVGGYSLKQTPEAPGRALARRQAQTSECLSAIVRSRSPGRFVFTSNILVHRAVLEACPFDEAFAGWGWEDTEWGLRVASRFPVIHIDNTATHMGVDDDAVLMAKYARSGPNFARLVAAHPDAMRDAPLLSAARIARRLPLRRVATRIAEAAARGPAPLPLRAAALKAWRALVYAEHI